jgi:hypothetical protein
VLAYRSQRLSTNTPPASHNSPKKLKDVAQDVKLISSGLEHLGEVFSEATVRAFVRPGALHTAQDAIAGCSEIFRDPSISQLSLGGGWVMSQFKILIDEGRGGEAKLRAA